MKKMKNVVFALVLISSVLLMSSMTAEPSAKTKVESSAKKRIIYSFYNSYYQLRIDYNPGNGTVGNVSYESAEGGQVLGFDHSGAGITYDSQTQTITLTDYQADLGNGWTTLNGVFTRM